MAEPIDTSRRNFDEHERAVRFAAYEANHNLLLAARVESLRDKGGSA